MLILNKIEPPMYTTEKQYCFFEKSKGVQVDCLYFRICHLKGLGTPGTAYGVLRAAQYQPQSGDGKTTLRGLPSAFPAFPRQKQGLAQLDALNSRQYLYKGEK